jgi:hypothetical protein
MEGRIVCMYKLKAREKREGERLEIYTCALPSDLVSENLYEVSQILCVTKNVQIVILREA